MRARIGLLILAVLAAPLAGQAQPALEQFRFAIRPGCAYETPSSGDSRIGGFPAAWPP
jgi:hypothetical protein